MRLGVSFIFIGKCGEDLFGYFLLQEMHKNGVGASPVIVPPGDATGLSVILTRGIHRGILTYPGLIPALKAGEIPDELLSQATHLYIASHTL